MEKKKEDLLKASEEDVFNAEDDVFNAEDLFAIQGGEDEDLDEDCYSMECLISSNTCFSPKSDCYLVN